MSLAWPRDWKTAIVLDVVCLKKDTTLLSQPTQGIGALLNTVKDIVIMLSIEHLTGKAGYILSRELTMNWSAP